MSEQGDHKNIAGVFSVRARMLARVVPVRTLAKRLFRAVDQIDYIIRHWLTPVTFEQRTRTRSIPHKKSWIPRTGLPVDIQNAIGRRLRAEYGLDRSMPLRLVILLKEFEQRTNAEAMGRGRYSSAV